MEQVTLSKVAEGIGAKRDVSFYLQMARNCELECKDDEAVTMYRKAAWEGSAEAQYKLGCYLYNGWGFFKIAKRDRRQAVNWFQKAYEQGHVRATYMLGLCYRWGTGVPAKLGNISKALSLWREAAAKGSVEAKNAIVAYYTLFFILVVIPFFVFVLFIIANITK